MSIPVGTKIRFTKDIYDPPCEEHPGILFARAGGFGEIRSPRNAWGYGVDSELQENTFTVSRDEFEIA